MGLNAADKKWLYTRFGDRVRFDEPMSGYTSFRVGGPAEVFVVPETDDEVMAIAKWAWEKKIDYFPLGGGTNLLVTESGIKGVVILLSQSNGKIIRDRRQPGRIIVEAGVKTARFCRWARENALSGTEFALGIPGTVGGAVMMNAGTALGCMADIIEAVSIYQPVRGIQTVPKEKLKFAYRAMDLEAGCDPKQYGLPIILSGTFMLSPGDPEELKSKAKSILMQRKTREPGRLPSAGCIFKNPAPGKSAGELIDRAGLKGRRQGGAEISTVHANYIVNRGDATAEDILSLMNLIRTSVKKRFDIDLEPEVKIIGD